MSNCTYTFNDPLNGDKQITIEGLPALKAYLFKGGAEALLGSKVAGELGIPVFGVIKQDVVKESSKSAEIDKLHERLSKPYLDYGYELVNKTPNSYELRRNQPNYDRLIDESTLKPFEQRLLSDTIQIITHDIGDTSYVSTNYVMNGTEFSNSEDKTVTYTSEDYKDEKSPPKIISLKDSKANFDISNQPKSIIESKKPPQKLSPLHTAINSGNVNTVLDHIIANSTTPLHQLLANKLINQLPEGINITIVDTLKKQGIEGVMNYNYNTRTVSVNLAVIPKLKESATEKGFIHELIHAVTGEKITAIISKDESTLTKDERIARTQLKLISNLITKHVEKNGITGELKKASELATENLRELITYGLTEPTLQKMLADIKIGKDKTAWTQFVHAIAKLLGIELNEEQETALSALLMVGDSLLGDTQAQHIEGSKLEAATQSVITKSLEKANLSDKKLSFNDVKKELLAQIDKAIPSAVSEVVFNENPEYKKLKAVLAKKLTGSESQWKKDEYDNEIAQAKTDMAKILPKITFDIKGDGKFTVTNSKEALAEFKAKVDKTSELKQSSYPTTNLSTKQANAVQTIDRYVKESVALKKRIEKGQEFLQPELDDTLQMIVDIAENNDITDNATVNKIRKELGIKPTDTMDSTGSTEQSQPTNTEESTQTETQQPSLTTKGIKIADKAEGNIQDFGEKLEGAKKFTYTLKQAIEEKIDVSSVPLSKSFPQPDYEKLIASGVKPQIAALIAQLRAEIPTKPQKGYKLTRWTTQVNTARESAAGLLDGSISTDFFAKVASEGDNYTRFMSDVLAIADQITPSQIKELGNFKLDHVNYAVYNGVKNVWKYEVHNISKQGGLGGLGNRKSFDTKEAALAYIKDEVTKDTPDGEAVTKFDLWTERGRDGTFIGKKVGAGKYIELAYFPTTKEAKAYVESNNKELTDLLKKKKTMRDVRRAENNQRVGKDYRNGKNVTDKQFSEAFGFRGVQFGNWVNNDRRQQDLNNAYDGLMDLADVLGIPPMALSLDGELGLAFGARGTGGVDPASAHYESGQVVINLTKERGAGSLAHEWWHALDNYFGKRENRAEFLSETSARNKRVQDGNKYRDSTDEDFNTRKEVFDAWQGVTEAIKKETGLVSRSMLADKKRSKDYWSTIREITARTFERYIIGKLADKGFESDYLANIISEDDHKIFNEVLGENEPYVYPLQSEMDAVNRAYDKLFGTVETKETDKGIALYSKSTKSTNTHTKSTLTSALRTVMDREYGSGFMQRLFDTGKFKVVSREEADRVIGSKTLYSKAFDNIPVELLKFKDEFKYDFLNFKDNIQFRKAVLHLINKKYIDKGFTDISFELGSENEIAASRNFSQAIYNANKAPVVNIQKPTNDELYGEYNSPSEVPQKVYKWLNKNENIITSDATDAVRWWRIRGTDKNARYGDEEVTIYRAVSDGSYIREGDWVTTSKEYAEMHLKKYLHGKGSVLEETVNGMDVLQSPTGNNEEAIYAPLEYSGENTEGVQYSKDGSIQAFYNPADDTTYFVAENIDKNKDLLGLASHEIGVHALQLGKNDTEFYGIMEQMLKIARISKPAKQALATALESFGITKVPEQDKPELVKDDNGKVIASVTREQVLHELGGYIVEHHPKLGVVQKFLAWFKSKLRAMGKALPAIERLKWVRWANSLNESDLVSMASGALRNAPNDLMFDSVGRGGEEVKLSEQQARFYSALRKAFLLAPEKVFTSGTAVKAWINGNAGKFEVKKDEIYWSGLNEWLDIQGKVSRDDVVKFLDENGVKVEDVELKEKPVYRYPDDTWMSEDGAVASKEDWLVDLKNVYGDTYFDEDGDEIEFDAEDYLQENLTNVSDDIIENDEHNSQFGYLSPEMAKHGEGDLVLPNGTDYRELVVTIPAVEKFNEDDSTHFGDVGKPSQQDINSFKKQKNNINQSVDDDFLGIIDRMKRAGVLEVNCD